MKSPQPLLIALLALTTIGGAALAWRQYGELVELRASAMNRDERADLQKRIWDLEKMTRELQDQLAARRRGAEGPGELVAEAGDGERPAGEREGRGGRGGDRGRGGNPMQQATAMRELMNKPEVQALMSVQQKAAIEARYAALFHSMNLTPEQTDKLKTLLAERGSTRMDVMAAGTAQGIDPRENPEAYRKLFADAQNELNNSIKSVVGENGFAQLQNYEQTLPQRGLVNDLQQRLSFSNTPLTPSQADALVQILASNQPPRSTPAAPVGPPVDGLQVQFTRGPGPGGPPGRGGDFVSIGGPGLIPGMGMIDGIGRGPSTTVTANAVAQAQTVLAPTQLAALQQIQQQQQAQQQLQQLVRDTLSVNQTAPAAGSAKQPGAGATPSTPPQRRTGGG